MKLIIISGRSGAGKSTALNVLEDSRYTCIDNLPIGFVTSLLSQALKQPPQHSEGFAIGIDARNVYGEISELSTLLSQLPEQVSSTVVYIDAEDDELIKRFSETRRKHPLSDADTDLNEALRAEKALLEPLAENANITIDTTDMQHHDLRDIVRRALVDRSQNMAIQVQSFGFKYGVPKNADYIFDVRCLANPHWEPSLKSLPGTDPRVKEFIMQHKDSQEMLDNIKTFAHRWLPEFMASNRQYTTVAIGCTGGRHRSVCLAEALTKYLSEYFDDCSVRHRDLGQLKNEATN